MDIRLKELLHNLKDRDWDVNPIYKIDENEAKKIIKAIEKVESGEKWVLCSERLPEEYDRVLCATNAEEIFIANYLGKLNDGADCFDDDDSMMWEGDVVAWQPLPQVYKAESEE